MARQRKPAGLQIDPRTAGMTDQALKCRDDGHPWTRRVLPPDVRKQNWDNGFVEKIRECLCGREWTQIFDSRTFELIEQSAPYPKEGFLVPRGSGRMPKAEARKAAFARENPELVAA